MKMKQLLLILVTTALAFGQSAGVSNVTVSFSSTPIFTANAAVTNFDITLSSSVVSSTFNPGGGAPTVGSLRVCQDATGGRTFTAPAGSVGFGAIDTAANHCSTAPWKWGSDGVLRATGPFVRETDGVVVTGGSGGMVYPSAGVPVSTGSAWGAPLGVQTTVGSPGLDTNIATEKAVRSAIPAPSGSTPVMDGSAAAGASANYSRADHVHPSDTGRMAAVSGTGAIKVTSGVPALVSGTGTDCVLVNGGSGPCAAASGTAALNIPFDTTAGTCSGATCASSNTCIAGATTGGTASCIIVTHNLNSKDVGTWVHDSAGVPVQLGSSGLYTSAAKLASVAYLTLNSIQVTFDGPLAGGLTLTTGGRGPAGANGTNGTNGTNGSPGAAGPTGAGYLATSATSLVTAGSGSKVFTLDQATTAYSAGARARATSRGTGEYMEGLVASISGATLAVTMDRNSGTGTHADWNVNLVGDVGATGSAGPSGSGSGDVLGPATNTNNFIPQWDGANSKTLKDGIDMATLIQTNATNTYGSSAVNDARAAAHTIPAKTGIASGKPATCTPGEEYFATDATAGQNKYYCTTTNTWTQQLNSGGGGSGTNTYYVPMRGILGTTAFEPNPIGVSFGVFQRFTFDKPLALTFSKANLQIAGTPIAGTHVLVGIYSSPCSSGTTLLAQATFDASALGVVGATLSSAWTPTPGAEYFLGVSSDASTVSIMGATLNAANGILLYNADTATRVFNRSAAVASSGSMPANCGTLALATAYDPLMVVLLP